MSNAPYGDNPRHAQVATSTPARRSLPVWGAAAAEVVDPPGDRSHARGAMLGEGATLPGLSGGSSPSGAERLLLLCLLLRSSWLTVEGDRHGGADRVLHRQGGRAVVAVSVGMPGCVPNEQSRRLGSGQQRLLDLARCSRLIGRSESAPFRAMRQRGPGATPGGCLGSRVMGLTLSGHRQPKRMRCRPRAVER